jgi:pimeloyl-ACP methyl ester carboxylesterase
MKQKCLLFYLFISNIFCCNLAAQHSLDEMIKVKINNFDMNMLIRSDNTSNPVLLYLHGGPGDSLIPFANYVTNELKKYCTVVYWDQRGAGLSYSTDIDPKTITIKQFVSDTKEVTRYLKNRFNKEKIFLLGHSWGSVLGILTIKEAPQNYYAYIGVGQVISEKLVQDNRIEWLEKVINKTNEDDKNALQEVKDGRINGFYLVRNYGGMIHNLSMQDMGNIMSKSPYGKYYSNAVYERGEKISQSLFDEVKSINIMTIANELPIPTYFFIGKYDYVTPAKPVENYFLHLKSTKKEIIRFDNSGHRMDIEEPQKFQNEIKRIILSN